ncbi:MAG TPA: exodeoxyribonuclease VII large subunit [Devosiaceae bacterium]|nr:exodeoxyribonuclease VII large subunit [Devosiaceae bacterium]
MDEPRSNVAEFSVSEIALAVKRTVEDQFAYVRVRGEISGYRGQHSSGHAYFSLKDADAAIDAVIWKTSFSRLRFKPEEGMEVIVTGRLTTFPRSSKYQIVIEQLEPAGAGALMALLEQRRKKLIAEGLFDPARKKKIPYLPRVIGVVTSPTGAVIRDILHRLDDRFPSHVLVWPVRVQGETSAAEVAAAVEGFNNFDEGGPIPRPDLLIVARGGGSIEDLWGFNEEIVVRAVAASRIPVISAVGHETDTTLCDYAADMRAPTPTAAAEAAVPVRVELAAYVEDLGVRQRQGARRLTTGYRDRVRAASAALPRPLDLLATARQRVDLASTRLGAALRAFQHRKAIALAAIGPRLSYRALRQSFEREARQFEVAERRLQPAMARLLADRGQRLASQAKLLNSLSYRGVLARGFALVTTEDGMLVRSISAVKPGQALDIEVADGHVAARAEGEAPIQPKPARRRVRDPSDESGQQSLF